MFPEPLPSGPLPLSLDEQQETVRDLLSRLSTKKERFDDWYLGALDAFNRKGFDYLSQAAHSIRELADRLPAVAGVPLFQSPLPPFNDVAPRLMALRRNAYQGGWEGSEINRELSVVLTRIEEICELCNAPPRSARLQHALTQKDPHRNLLAPRLQRQRDQAFKDLYNFFQNVAHHNHSPTDAAFLENLRAFERLLIQYLTPVTVEQQIEITSIIERSPAADSKARLNDLLIHNSANLVFLLEKLENAEWLTFLSELGMFEQLPPAESSADGGVIYRNSIALSALARLAPKAPELALSILEQLPASENPLVTDQIMRCVSRIETAELAARLLAVVKPLLLRRGSSDWIWLQEIFATWVRMGLIEQTVELLRSYLAVMAGQRGAGRSAQVDWQLQQIDQTVIGQIAVSQPPKIADVLFRALIRWASVERLEGTGGPSSGTEPEDPANQDAGPMYWLPDFKSPSIGDGSFETVIARRLYDVGGRILQSGDQSAIAAFDGMLRSHPWRLFRRLRWQLYADFPAQTQAWARTDTLERIPFLGSAQLYHGSDYSEFSQMVEAHARGHGPAFLSSDEVASYVQAVLSGPTSTDEPPNDEAFRNRFWRKQLHPLRTLLTGEALRTYHRLSEGKRELTASDYRLFSSVSFGTVEHVAPARANDMDSMSDEELRAFMNTWRPTAERQASEQGWVEEDEGALGLKFAEYLNAHPERFFPNTRWWEKLHRPAVLQKVLERAVERLSKKPGDGESVPPPPTESDWQNWFGVAGWIVNEGSPAASAAGDVSGIGAEPQAEWDWPRITVVRFLIAQFDSAFQCPDDRKGEIGQLLRQLVEDEDHRLTGKDAPWMSDWLTTAINSVRGTAFEGLLKLGLWQKEANPATGPEPWIFEVIESSLRLPGQSPALFAILGARTDLVLYIFGERFNDLAPLLLPPNRKDARAAFIVSHFLYHQAMPALLKAIPTLPDAALDCLNALSGPDAEHFRARGDFAGRLGFHLAYYYWNGSFHEEQTANAALDRFFQIATPASRGTTIGQIAQIFKTAPPIPEHAALFERAMKLWDRRLSRIEELLRAKSQLAADFHDELSHFTRWMECECFPFEWRYERVLRAIRLIEKAPAPFSLVEILSKISSNGEHVRECLSILDSLLSKTSRDVRWHYREENLKPLLRRGSASGDRETKRLAGQIQESLLRTGCFEYLHIDQT